MVKMRKIGVATAGLAALVSGLVVVAPAQAAFSSCPANRLCMFSEPYGNGVMASFQVGDANLGDGVGPIGMNNTAQSFRNNTGQQWCLYDFANYGGELLGVSQPNSTDQTVGPIVRNRTTSLRPC